MKIPTVHLNGTSKGELARQLEEAGTAIGEAMLKLAACAPHGRDYYPQGDEAWIAARNEHWNRMQRLETVRTELQVILEGVDEQKGGRS